MNEGKRRVILNKVFPNASYMTQLGNLGHEIINLFKEDTGYRKVLYSFKSKRYIFI